MTHRSMLVIEYDRDAHDDDRYYVKYFRGNFVSQDLDSISQIEGEFYNRDRMLEYVSARVKTLWG